MDRLMPFLATIAAVCVGCSPTNMPPNDAAVKLRLTANCAPVDQELIELVALSLIDDPEFRPNAPREDRFDSIIIAGETVDFDRVPQCLHGDEAGNVPAEATESLLRRNTTSLSIHEMVPRSPAILVDKANGELCQAIETLVHPGQAEGRRTMGRKPKGCVHVSLPGYSGDGNSAVVVVQFGWSMHSASGAFHLVRHAAGWKIKSRWFEYYV